MAEQAVTDLPPLHMDEPPTRITPAVAGVDVKFIDQAMQLMDRHHHCLVGEAAKAWGVTVTALHAVLAQRALPSKKLRQAVEGEWTWGKNRIPDDARRR